MSPCDNIKKDAVTSCCARDTVGKLLEMEIQNARECAERIVDSVREPLVVLSAKLKILAANNIFYDISLNLKTAALGGFSNPLYITSCSLPIPR